MVPGFGVLISPKLQGMLRGVEHSQILQSCQAVMETVMTVINDVWFDPCVLLSTPRVFCHKADPGHSI